MLTYDLTSIMLKIQIKLSESRWAAWRAFLKVQALLVAIQICLWAILSCCICFWRLNAFRPHSYTLPKSCGYQAVEYSQVPGTEDGDVMLSLKTEARSYLQGIYRALCNQKSLLNISFHQGEGGRKLTGGQCL